MTLASLVMKAAAKIGKGGAKAAAKAAAKPPIPAGGGLATFTRTYTKGAKAGVTETVHKAPGMGSTLSDATGAAAAKVAAPTARASRKGATSAGKAPKAPRTKAAKADRAVEQTLAEGNKSVRKARKFIVDRYVHTLTGNDTLRAGSATRGALDAMRNDPGLSLSDINGIARRLGLRRSFRSKEAALDAISAHNLKRMAAHQNKLRGKGGRRSSGGSDGEPGGSSGDVWGPMGGFDGDWFTPW